MTHRSATLRWRSRRSETPRRCVLHGDPACPLLLAEQRLQNAGIFPALPVVETLEAPKSGSVRPACPFPAQTHGLAGASVAFTQSENLQLAASGERSAIGRGQM